MTVFPRLWPRPDALKGVPVRDRLFSVAPDTQVMGVCSWQPAPKSARTLIVIHGLEGCHESHYMEAMTGKGWRAGLNVIRLNQRTCGGTEHLTPSLYHSGLSGDVRAVVTELMEKDGLRDIWVAGFSMGGQLALRMAGEAETSLPALRGVFAVCPNLDPPAVIAALERPMNRFYQDHFLQKLKDRVRRKARLFPRRFDVAPIERIKGLRAFDHLYTAPEFGFAGAEDYYARVGASHVLHRIRVPTVILTAQDDPIIPFRSFQTDAIGRNPAIRLVAPRHGGHCGFIQRRRPGEDRYWAENRILDAVLSA
jgi:predicted alpha/beta-fold hydrolase